MNSISLKSMPTSEIIFSFLNLGLNKDLASQTLEKRLKGYGLSDDEIVNFIAREIVKIKTRGNDLEDYCFRKNRSVEELVKTGFIAISRTDNFNNLTISEVLLLQDIFRRLKEYYSQYIKQITRRGDPKEMSFIFPKVNSNYEYYNLLYKILLDIACKEYDLNNQNLISSIIIAFKVTSLFEFSATKEHLQSMSSYQTLSDKQILQDESILETYCPRLK